MSLTSPSFRHLFGSALLAAGLAGCAALPAPPQEVIRYDLGGPPALVAGQAASLPALALADIQAPLQTDGQTGLQYRLGYAEAQVLYAYSQARWSLPPAQMVQQRLREHLSLGGRVVLSAESGLQPPQVGGQQVPVLRLALEDFSQVFADARHSVGLVRVRATLVDPNGPGDTLLAQQLFEVRQPAQAANAAGGAQALALGVDEVGRQLNVWLQALGR